jgi:hypothetical protein
MTRLVSLLAAGACLAAVAGPASAIDVVGRSVKIGWAKASGPVSGYGVYVSRNGGAYQLKSGTTSNQATIIGGYGETLRVKVAAVGGNAAGVVFGPLSASSPPIRFVRKGAAPSPSAPPAPPELPGEERVRTVNTGAVGSMLVLGDLDGDGRDDYVWYRLRERGAVAWLSRHGRRELKLPFKQAHLVAADLDGDGLDELVAHHRGNGAVSRSTTRGWQALAKATAPGADVLAADVDGNGRDELLVRDAAGGLFEQWLVKGATVTRRRLPTVLAQESLAVGDVNGDRRDDLLLVHTPSGRAELWISNGALPGARRSLPSLPVGAVALLADVDGDAKADLLYPDPVSGLLMAKLLSGSNVRTTGRLAASRTLPVAGDLDGDGDDDFVFPRAKAATILSWESS